MTGALGLLMAVALAGDAAPAREALAQAVDAWHRGDESAAASFEALFELRPWDDDNAYWAAVSRYAAGDCEQAARALMGRDGVAWPAWRLRELEGRAWACAGEPKRAVPLLEQAIPDIDAPDLARAARAVLAMLVLDERPAQAAALLAAAGGDAAKALDPVAAKALGRPALGYALPSTRPTGRLRMAVDGGWWSLDLATGLALPATAPPTSPTPEALVAAPALRSEVQDCGGAWVWASPSEPLAGGLGGLFRLAGGRVTPLVASPLPGGDQDPRCAGERVVAVRRGVRDHSVALLVAPSQVSEIDAGAAAVRGVDVRPDGAVLLAVQDDGGQRVLWAPPGELRARALVVGAPQPTRVLWER